MIKNEQSRNVNQEMMAMTTSYTISRPPPPLAPVPVSFIQPTSAISNQRVIDTNAMDITSLKGQFAWEKIPNTDIYMPVIFRDNIKYFCVRMLRKLLPEYPEDILHYTYQYQYRKPINLCSVTINELELLNRINSHHSRWTFSRLPFTKSDEIIRVSDFIPFYEHLRHNFKSNTTTNTLKQLLPQQQIQQRSSDYMNNMPTILRGQTTITSSSPYLPPIDLSRQVTPTTSNVPRPIAPVASNVPRPIAPAASSIPHPMAPGALNISRPTAPSTVSTASRQQKSIVIPHTTELPQRSTTQQIQSTSSLTNNTPTVLNTPSSTNHSLSSLKNNTSAVLNTPSSINHSLSSPIIPSLTTTPLSSSSPIMSSPQPTVINQKLPTKPSRLHCGWLQVNKLYTPYISPSATNHHLYKLPVSLLSFYSLLKTTINELNDSKDYVLPFEQIVATTQELDMINELCIKQNIQPFNLDTKLIELSTFYKYCSANIIFIKELPINEPKMSICKEWSLIVQINGGICRLRNITTLHEQTVPFIGNNLLKNFILSSQTLLTSTLTKPTDNEIEFLQLILFFSNMSINLRNAQLIDIESVKKEYNVDLILLFNDKFPLNVLNYQQQGNRSNTVQPPIIPPPTTAPTNTIAESTPPPSPPSPPPPPPSSSSTTTNSTSSQLPLTSSTNRYYKTIEFHGHSLTAYICSGLDTNAQRECVSIKSLCNILYPNITSIDKLELKMLKLLRLKNINRFRPQNQQSMSFTRLIDIKDAEKHWDSIEKEMRAMINDDGENRSNRSSVSSVSNENSKASIMDKVENDKQSSSEKRPLDESLDEEDIPVLERLNKRVRLTEKENNMDNDKSIKKRTIKLSFKKKPLPSTRTNKQSKATWVRKYNIEDCCIRLNQYDPIYDTETD